MRRHPFPIPWGWFQIAFADDVARSEVKPLRYFGRELVLWRGEDDALHLQDAFCPHLGAHLGHGGRVDGNALRCPFHAWAFDGSGRCVDVPYARRAAPTAHLGTWPLAQVGQFVMAWFHPDGAAPSFELPDVPEFADASYGPLVRRSWQVKTVPQEMAENTFDPAHFQTIHGHPEVGETEAARFEGVECTMLSKQVFPSSRGPVDARIDVYQTGPGFSLTRYQGLVEALLIGTATPIDEETTENRFSFSCRNPDGSAQVERIADAFVAEVSRQFEQDIPIWEHKIYREKPPLVEVEAGIPKFRRWYSQFYESAATARKGA